LLAKLRIGVHKCPCKVSGPVRDTNVGVGYGRKRSNQRMAPEDAHRVLEAVKMAADGLITKSEMLAKIADAAGVTHFEDVPEGATVLGFEDLGALHNAIGAAVGRGQRADQQPALVWSQPGRPQADPPNGDQGTLGTPQGHPAIGGRAWCRSYDRSLRADRPG
jgi:hypothetical protein